MDPAAIAQFVLGCHPGDKVRLTISPRVCARENIIRNLGFLGAELISSEGKELILRLLDTFEPCSFAGHLMDLLSDIEFA